MQVASASSPHRPFTRIPAPSSLTSLSQVRDRSVPFLPVWAQFRPMRQAGRVTDASRPRRVAMLAPMPSELRPIVRKVPLHRSQLGELAVHTGTIGATEVVATRTGMGMPSATRAAEAILDAGPVDHVLIVGIAGGVAPGLEIGQVLVPDVVVDGHTRAEYRPSPFGGVTAAGRLET